ncbi:MAG: NAD(P)H-quinone oxidoreductase subunit F [Oscillatoriaceae bacterium SKW80]|nr:NAD(P)H-quinone oxidoreductase subunit F [Oscillatoriaceae bacterium SKYG93]MCX8119585.1 NAD(P)H-quinone oxidoreductase subunit F [Oscillatoriaceae bacterium SKW80]MDW8455052.1 NAD(P)H-quinone oxidoreductase subunit F [Oscillatoriaceae cyanobacterium SKYGB_i_bin93]HIK28171.1 NAD(P)H-quinone oxidoreductase subunit F [Oscillatoriaceae cyanobacterium M7585_C2015_266]
MNQFLFETIWCIPLYGLVGAILTLPWSMGIVRRTGPRPAAYLNIFMTLLAFIHGWFVFRLTWNQEPQELIIHWLRVADVDLSLALDISSVSTGAVELVTGLSLLAQVFAVGYMEKDWGLARFFALMGFFEGAMSGLAISNSLFLSYALLEMLTLSTYLLVGFWYAQPLVVTAARDAFLTKRVGDVLLLMGVVALAALAGSLNFNDLYNWAETASLSPTVATLLGLALIAGPTGKCAQFPLHLWLDEAMEGPNPASILRNSVVVATGAYVLIKLQPILVLSPVAQKVLIVIGTITASGASLVTLAQIDIKRALSHSTSAYLGLVFIAVGMQWTNFAGVLLFTHAIAKALLFMSVGCVISTTNNQNLTEMGGLWSRMPATTAAFLVGSAGLVGLLPLGGFWAFREGIDVFWISHPWVVGVLLTVNCLTALNLTRVFRLVFLGKPQPKTRRAPEVPWLMAVPMVSLMVVTLLVPVMMLRLQILPDLSYLNIPAVVVLVLSGLTGVIVGALIPLQRTWSRPIQIPLRFLQDFLAYDFYIDRLYRLTVVFAVDCLSRLTAWFDRYIVDGAVNLVALSAIFGGEGLKYNVSGQSQFYVLTIVICLFMLVMLITKQF